MLKRISAVALFLTVALMAFGQTRPAGAQTELQRLQIDYNKAMQEYYKPYQSAHTQEEMAKIKLDPRKDPNPVYLPRFKKMAEQSGKTSDGFQAWMMVKRLAEQSRDEKTENHAVDVIMTQFIDTPWIGQFATMLSYSYYTLPPDQREKKVGGLLERIENTTAVPAVKAAALYARAQLIAGDGQGNAAAATKLYREIMAKYPDTEQGKRAGRDIFEMENLVVGKVAPDFDATDQDGIKFKLSDYRGKVVVLDFWGFW